MSKLLDTLIVETLLSDPMHKTASVSDDIGTAVKNYLGEKIEKDAPVSSIINLIAPGVIWEIMGMFGFGWIGMFMGLAMNVFDINITDLFGSLCDEIKQLVSSGQPVSSSQVDQIINQHAQAASGDDNQVSATQLLHQAKILKLAIIDFEHQSLRLMKTPFNPSQTYLYKMAGKSAVVAGTKNLLVRIVGTIIKNLLKAAGLLVGGDVVRTVENKPPAHLAVNPMAGPPPLAQGDSPLPKAITMVNTPDNIEQMLFQFAKDIYGESIADKEEEITSSPAFQKVKGEIVYDNSHHPNSSIISLPAPYSKKQLVDQFMTSFVSA
jgi:hypothetical protein